jgi:hypothetical protein
MIRKRESLLIEAITSEGLVQLFVSSGLLDLGIRAMPPRRCTHFAVV